MKRKVIQTKKTVGQVVLLLLFSMLAGPGVAGTGSLMINQEKILVAGTVLDNSGAPLANVSVVEKEAKGNSTSTDANGRFTLRVASTSTLLFSYVGYKTTEIAASTGQDLTIRLVEDALNLDEVVVTDHGLRTEHVLCI